ncbi:HNH endonuclease [Mycobacterium rhizamassiliense]|uniref:HNH endonuclease n=1 Tax=Mycobacterium rhizamassiliense TaxID=1841860 RepID=A0A2U3NWD4_9MYCO|nr:HNH endonuclease [Mycobacterium rhizamassiliense]
MVDKADTDVPELLPVLVDAVLPLLKPYEFSLYLLLLRASEFRGGEIRIGKRTISARLGQGTRASRGNYNHITEKLNVLAEAGFIAVGDTSREGTQYRVLLPEAIPAVREVIATSEPPEQEPDYFTDPVLRAELMERDKWTCRYCGEVVTATTATLDHIIPQSLGGPNTPENLTTACLTCNAIKSGRTYEEAAPEILGALVRRKATTS